MTMEVGFEQSAVARLRKLLQIGTGTWRGERYPGYPVNQVGCWTSMAVAASGATASERRASRVGVAEGGAVGLRLRTSGAAAPMMAFFSLRSGSPAADLRRQESGRRGRAAQG